MYKMKKINQLPFTDGNSVTLYGANGWGESSKWRIQQSSFAQRSSSNTAGWRVNTSLDVFIAFLSLRI